MKGLKSSSTLEKSKDSTQPASKDKKMAEKRVETVYFRLNRARIDITMVTGMSGMAANTSPAFIKILFLR